MSFHCAECNALHEGLPDIGMTYPQPYLDVPEEDRALLTTVSLDRCTVRQEDAEHYFIRGVIFVPVHEQVEPWGIGVWISQSKTNFDLYKRKLEMAPTVGWLMNSLPFYDRETLHLKCRAQFHYDGRRPSFEVEPTDHPLSLDQRNGIPRKRAWDIVHSLMPS